MGVGSSTSRPGSATILVKSRPPSELSFQETIDHTSQSNEANRPTGSCCSHYRKNHSGITRTVTPVSTTPVPPRDNIEDDIEEIVANTLDLVSNPNPDRADSSNNDAATKIEMKDLNAKSDSEILQSAKSRHVELQNTSAHSARVVQKRPSNEISEDLDGLPIDAKDFPEVDFAKFKKVNHKGSTITPNGRVMHHQESDLLWRLGLISPEAYKMSSGPRSAPSNQGAYLKTPSYDLTEEQLMANIEKEFECTTAI